MSFEERHVAVSRLPRNVGTVHFVATPEKMPPSLRSLYGHPPAPGGIATAKIGLNCRFLPIAKPQKPVAARFLAVATRPQPVASRL